MFEKYLTVRISWFIFFLMASISLFVSVWYAFLKKDWTALGLTLFFVIILLGLYSALQVGKR